MQDVQDRPSTETEATPTPPKGENVKALVTPGDDAEKEAEAERVTPPGGKMPGASEADSQPNVPMPGDIEELDSERAEGASETDAQPNPEDPEEAESPT